MPISPVQAETVDGHALRSAVLLPISPISTIESVNVEMPIAGVVTSTPVPAYLVPLSQSHMSKVNVLPALRAVLAGRWR